MTNIEIFLQAIPGVSKIKEGYNHATWMLDVSSICSWGSTWHILILRKFMPTLTFTCRWVLWRFCFFSSLFSVANLYTFVLIYSWFFFSILQKKSGTYQGAKRFETRFWGSLLPHTVLPKLYNSVQGLFLEATLVILEKLTVQCNSFFHDDCHWYSFWCYLLEQRRPDVSLKFFMLNFIFFCVTHLY